ncbi:MAG: hypothetical protein WDO18_16880 [Acidobacteriota bacterium]
MQADYSTLMPFIVKALLENRTRYERMAAEIGEEALFAQEPPARGYLRPRDGYRLFAQRDELVNRLNRDVAANREWLLDSVRYLVA